MVNHDQKNFNILNPNAKIKSKCPFCKQSTKFIGFKRGYRKFCDIGCAVKARISDESITEKILIKNRIKFIENGIFHKRLKILKDHFLIDPLFTEQDYIDRKILKWKHICGTEFETKNIEQYPCICPNIECRKISSPQRENMTKAGYLKIPERGSITFGLD